MPSSAWRSEEHTSELQSLRHLVCRLLLGKRKSTRLNSSHLGSSYAVFYLKKYNTRGAARPGAQLSSTPSIRFSYPRRVSIFFFFNDTATTEIYTLSLHDALPISSRGSLLGFVQHCVGRENWASSSRSEEHTSELQSLRHLVCRLLLEKKKQT